jgi:predicted RNase H-like HicB family nuclease
VTARYTVVIVPDPEGGDGFLAVVPALAGVATHGASVDEARDMARDLIRSILEDRLKHGEPAPHEAAAPLVELIEVA